MRIHELRNAIPSDVVPFEGLQAFDEVIDGRSKRMRHVSILSAKLNV
jgi:hypothetical protein